MKRAALYLRSSKDRSDVSIDAQRRALTELAKAKGFALAAEFADAVESGKDEDRPGFQRLIEAVRNPRRGWDTILVHDTSRLARRRVLAIIFEEVDCRRNGVTVVYKSLPDADPITEMMLKSILQAMDEWHSLTSKQKGLAGMRENVLKGYRAGGRAPLGYRIRKVHTGAMRDGEPVTKSMLELDPATGPKVGAYLTQRAAGMAPKHAADAAGLEVAKTTLVGVEWNALTYAGHTVWNVHAEREGGSYVGGSKRRPRSEWVIQRDTHPALIGDDDAEAILARLEANNGQRAAARRARGDGLLSGLLFTDGKPWHREGPEYRLRSAKRSVAAAGIEDAVLGRIYQDLIAPDMARRLLEATQATLGTPDLSELTDAKRELAAVERAIDRQMELAGLMQNPAPALRKVEEMEGRRAELAQRVVGLDREALRAKDAANISEADVTRLLEQTLTQNKDDARALALSVVERVELEPSTHHLTIHYRIHTSVSGDKLASPRRREPNTGFPLRLALRFALEARSRGKPCATKAIGRSKPSPR